MKISRIGLAASSMAAAGILLVMGIAHSQEVKPSDAKAETAAVPEGMVVPRYTDDGRLMVPENYRGWVFVGASIGLSYNEAAQQAANAETTADPAASGEAEGPHYNPGLFHHTYIQPEAYARYRATGKFPEKTMLILELHESVQKVQPDTKGFSQGRRVALEVAVKNHERVPEGWAYYNFALKDNKPADSARNFPKGMCHNCHNQHAKDDHVFTQFYPVLIEAKAAWAAEQTANAQP